MNRAPIGLFDSGFGGLTVMREISRLLPCEDLIYLGDTAHLPYGNKSPSTVLHCARENASFLLGKGIKLLIVACHTASAHALENLQKELPVPVIGVIQAGLQLLMPYQKIAILGTRSTIESGVYQNLLKSRFPQILFSAIACPLFVPFIEEGFIDHPAAALIAQTYLKPILGVEAALLACTHYPLIKPLLQSILGPQTKLLEPAALSAAQAAAYLSLSGLLNPQKSTPSYQYYTTEAPERFQKMGALFLGREIQETILIEKK